MARPALFSAKIGATLIKARSRGLTNAACAREAGISEGGLNKWLARTDEPYATFAEAYRSAYRAHQRRHVESLAAQLRAVPT